MRSFRKRLPAVRSDIFRDFTHITCFYTSSRLPHWQPIRLDNSGTPLVWHISGLGTFYGDYPDIDLIFNKNNAALKVCVYSEDYFVGVTYVDMSGLELVRFAPDFSQAINLTYLDISRNKFTENLANLYSLNSLQTLLCYSSTLAGDFPDTRGAPVLEKLYLYNNDLANDIKYFNPTFVDFDVSDNLLITGIIPDASLAHNLQNFSVRNCRIDGITNFSNTLTTTNFDFRSNLLTVTEVDNLLHIMDTCLGYGSGKILLAPGDNAKPSAVGLTYKYSLVAKGWTVVT